MAEWCLLSLNKVDTALWNAFQAADDLDWFIMYKNTTPIALSDESMAKLFLVNSARSLKWIWLYTKSWVPIAFTKEYYIMRDYLVNYSRKDNFMWMFRMLYWEWKLGEQAFRELQKKVREDMDSFFFLIERWTERQEKQQEYFFRLIRLIRDDEYNDVKLLLALFPDMREVLTNQALFKKYFWVDFTNSRSYRIIRETIAKKWGIYARMPQFRLWNKDTWSTGWEKEKIKWLNIKQRLNRIKENIEDTPIFNWATLSSHTYYEYLPDDVKAYFFREKFKLPDDLELQEITQDRKHYKWWDEIYITNDTFMKLDREDQEKLYDALFDAYKESSPENLATLEKHIENSKKYFAFKHWWWTLAAWISSFFKAIWNPVWYAATLILYKLPVWLLSMLALNSWLHLPRYLANEDMNLHFWWDWWKFCKQQWIFKRDIKFWDIIKRWFKQWDYKNSFQYMFVWMNRQFTEIAEAQFFNVADVAMTSYYRRNIAEEYLSYRYPFMKSFDEYSDMLWLMSKEEREAEINQFVKYIDDKMYTRYNNSLDTNRYTKWFTLPSEVKIWKKSISIEWIIDPLQEVINFMWWLWKFYRRFMITYNNSVMNTIKEWWRNWNSHKQIKELMEQYYAWKKTRQEVSDIINNTFARNQDLQYLLTTALYSFLLAKNIFKYDVHWNWEDENEIADAALLNEFVDLYKLFFFPIEAWERTWIWMWITAMFDAMSLDLSLEDNAKLIAWYEYKTVTKQLAKSQWILRWFVKYITDHIYNAEQRDELTWDEKVKRSINDITTSIRWFWYYLLDDISRSWFEEYTPKTQTALLKEIFWTREYSIEMFDDISKKQWILKIWTRDDFQNWLAYNTPYAAQYHQWQFVDQTWLQHALKQRVESNTYRTMMAKWELPAGITDEEWYDFYIMMTQYNPKSLEDIWFDFLVDWARTDKDTWELRHDYEKEAKEKIWHSLMITNVDEDLVKEAIRLLSTAEKDYQWQALSALMYLEAQTPWAWQKVLWYYISAKATEEVFSWKYWYFKRQDDWEYSVLDKAKINEAFRLEWIKLAKQFFVFEQVLDKEVWAQASLKLAKDSDLEISDYIKDLSDSWYWKLWIYPEKVDLLEARSDRLAKRWIEQEAWTSTDLYEVYKLNTYATIAAAEWMPDWYKMYNMFSKLFSASWKKDENWKLTKEWAESMLYAYNSLMELVDWFWISDVEKTVIMSSALLQSDQFISELMKWKTPEEIKQDPYIQTALHFLWWTADLVNALADRKISEVVQKKYSWTDPEEVSLSWVTNSKGTKKHWYSNWKQYYNNNKYLYDQVKYMTSKYHKYYNYLYNTQPSNVKRYYTRSERDALKFWPSVATIRWNWGSWRRNNEQDKPGWSLTQNRWKARPFTNRWDLDKIPDRKTKPKNRRTRAYAVGSKVRNKLIPWRRRYIKARQRDIPTLS